MKKLFSTTLVLCTMFGGLMEASAYYSYQGYGNQMRATVTSSYTIGCTTYYYDQYSGQQLYTKYICTTNNYQAPAYTPSYNYSYSYPQQYYTYTTYPSNYSYYDNYNYCNGYYGSNCGYGTSYCNYQYQTYPYTCESNYYNDPYSSLNNSYYNNSYSNWNGQYYCSGGYQYNNGRWYQGCGW